MSTIRVDNFGPSAGGTTYSARGIAKAWVNFNGTGTIATRDSENVSSLTDNGTGIYTVNFSNNFSAADYAFAASNNNYEGGDNWQMALHGTTNTTAAPSLFTASQAKMSVTRVAALADVNVGTAMYYGDLA